ncbi:MAG: GGDEF domain-containing protein [Armatimonadetes bacterium]|nr:GGDEF domain-containing protein [Armatimonadota bacterium]
MEERDKLTGLYVQEYFVKRLKEEINRSNRYKRPLALLLFEIDFNYFIKSYDIRWGMSYTILKQIGALLLKIYRNVDLAGRYEGELFGVILPETPENEALIAAERMREAVEEKVFRGDDKLPRLKLAINCGIAAYPKYGKTYKELTSSAKRALLEAKKLGGNKVVFPPDILYEDKKERGY